MHDIAQQEQRQAPRRAFNEQVEFFVDSDIVDASSIDISEGGIRLQTQTPITICMRMEFSGELEERRARLVWASRGPDDSMTYGLQFADGCDSDAFDAEF
jgi:hypothetical protein